MTRYLYRVVDRNGDDSRDPQVNYDDTTYIATWPTIHLARRERDLVQTQHRGDGPFRILRVPVTAWEEVK